MVDSSNSATNVASDELGWLIARNEFRSRGGPERLTKSNLVEIKPCDTTASFSRESCGLKLEMGIFVNFNRCITKTMARYDSQSGVDITLTCESLVFLVFWGRSALDEVRIGG